ncbi:hypothetical protein RUM44_001915 [Polyplax serrata]|uniref:Uncharacterized protein n=1 Tax=Polyplax serrata TaxID=468196 RepID=A0ABR1ALD6_POLSC
MIKTILSCGELTIIKRKNHVGYRRRYWYPRRNISRRTPIDPVITEVTSIGRTIIHQESRSHVISVNWNGEDRIDALHGHPEMYAGSIKTPDEGFGKKAFEQKPQKKIAICSGGRQSFCFVGVDRRQSRRIGWVISAGLSYVTTLPDDSVQVPGKQLSCTSGLTVTPRNPVFKSR